MKTITRILAATTCAAFLVLPAQGEAIFAPGDPIVGGQASADLSIFEEGSEGFVIPGNNWPGAEGPERAIDGVGQKYLNFGVQNTGILVSPSIGQSILNEIEVWTANDAVERDPISYQLWGSNDPNVHASIATGDISLESFTLVNEGPLNLPDSGPSQSRNPGGDTPLGRFRTLTTFDNVQAFCTYAVIFDDVKDPVAANSMQISEVQVHGDLTAEECSIGVVPEPSSLALAGFGFLALLGLRRRK